MISMRTKKYGRVVVVANPSVLKHYKEVFSGIREVMVIPINEVPDFLNSLARKAGDGAFRIQKNANDSF